MLANEGGVTSKFADTALPVETWPVVHLGADIDRAVLRFSCSRDGIDWLAIGPELDTSTLSDDFDDRLRFTGGVACICAQDLMSSSTIADFSHFAIEPLAST